MDYLIFQKLNSLAGQWLWLDAIIIFCAEFLIWFMPLVLVLVYFLSNRADKNKFRSHALRFILIVGVSFIITQLIGFIYFRARPFVSQPVLHQLIVIHSEKSFPSDHATVAFAVALALFLIDKKIGIIFFICGLLIGLARITGGIHYPFDILGGLLVAVFSTWLISRFMRKYKI